MGAVITQSATKTDDDYYDRIKNIYNCDEEFGLLRMVHTDGRDECTYLRGDR